MTVHKCLHSHAPDYTCPSCARRSPKSPNDSIFEGSANRRLLVVPGIQLDTYSCRALIVIGPTVWNALSNDLRDPDLSIASFGRLLKTHLLQQYAAH